MTTAIASHIMDNSTETNLCKTIKQRFEELLQKNTDLIHLPPNDDWLSAYLVSFQKDIEQLKRSMKKLNHVDFSTINIQGAGVEMKFEVKENVIIIVLKSNTGSVNLSFSKTWGASINVGKHYPVGYQNYTVFCFFLDGHAVQKSAKQNKFVPVTLKNIVSNARENILFSLFMQSYFEVMSEKYVVYKDLLRDFRRDIDNLWAPITLNAIVDGSWPTYQTIFRNHYKLGYEVPKSVNKMRLSEAYLKVKACKYVNPNEIQKIMMLSLPEKPIYYYNEKGLFVDFYRPLIEKPCKNKKLNQLEYEEKEMIVQDYIKMAISVEKKVPLTMRSFRAIADRHNKLIDPYMRKNRAKKMVIPKDSPYRKLKLPPNYTLIKTGRRLYEEGESMHHCVYSYREDVNAGKCAIAHIKFKDRPYTAEIRIKGGKGNRGFYCRQLYGPWDTPAPEEVWKDVQDVLKENQRILQR
jgi:hypothetical protein